MSQFKQELITQAGHAVPSLTMITTWWMGITLDQLYKGAGVGFIVLQAAYLIWKWWKEAKKRNEN
jgi:hypothetical protein